MIANTLKGSSIADPPKKYGAIPSERQLRWHEMEMYCLIHFTPTTFQNKEWGFGDADPKIFNPTNFDAQQIAKAAASAGFKGLISVAKHHDGFCLWPTSTTQYNISKSPWKGGNGDMVKEFDVAARDAGMKFGVYLSAWDRNDTRYGTPEYAEAYRQQLTELMTNYGELFTSWHDGANGGDGYYGGRNEKRTIDRSTYYEWTEKTWPIVRKLQPMAVIFSDIGPDVRWVGNEKGFAAETSWSTITPKSIDGKTPVPGQVDDSNLSTGDRNGEFWIPAECDVPQRPGWFYHPDQDNKVKTPNDLFEIYLKSVGRGANMNIGLAPNLEGRLHANDIRSLEEFGKKISETFAENLVKGATITASNVRNNDEAYGTQNILDDDRYTYYASDDNIHSPVLEIDLQTEKTFDLIQVRENIKLGQRLDSVMIENYEDGRWVPIANATSIGANRLMRLATPLTTQKIRIHLFAPVAPTLSDFGLFKISDRNIEFDQASIAGEKIEPYKISFVNRKSLDQALDNNPNTFVNLNNPKKGVVIDLQGEKASAITYLPRQDGKKDGMILKYLLEGSQDGKSWETIEEGEFSNIKSNPVEFTIPISSENRHRYLRLKPIEVEGKILTIAEIGIIR